jgi:hypothetical protein
VGRKFEIAPRGKRRPILRPPNRRPFWPKAEQPERKSVVDDLLAMALRRRVDDMEGAGLDNPFFQPRDGVSHSVIRRNC